jgi:hypothetical protein
MRKTFINIILFLISIQAFGTAQIPDILIYNGDTLSLFDCPLEYLHNRSFTHPRNLFGSSGCFYTACWRNYVATWEIIDNKLYLISIRNACYPTSIKYVEVSYQSGSDTIGSEYANLKKLFPEKCLNGKVLADWVSSKMVSPKGKMLYYIHEGFLSIFEKEIEFTIEKGILIQVKEFDNSKTKASKFTNNPELITDYVEKSIDYSNLPPFDSIVKVIVAVFGSDDSGKINRIKIMRGFNEVFDKEAERVVKSIPEWDVLYRHGERIPNIIWSIPVIFKPKK